MKDEPGKKKNGKKIIICEIEEWLNQGTPVSCYTKYLGETSCFFCPRGICPVIFFRRRG